jgi:type I restriction enzyme R subunit
MVAEINFEKELVVKYLVDKLAYEHLTSSEFNSNYLMIPSVVKQFITKNNQQLCKSIIKNDFSGNEDEFWNKFMSELSYFLYGSAHNIAIQLHPKRHGGFKFLGKYSFHLYYAFDIREQDKNLYHVVRQIPFLIKDPNGKFLKISPDVGVFVNGFMVSFMQLKLQHRNQSAEHEGRGQILGDYFEAISDGVVDCLSPTMSQDVKNDLIFHATKQFHGPIHMVSMDTSAAYILRGVNRYYSDIEKELSNSKAGGDGIKKEILNNFFIDPVYVKEPGSSLIDKMEKVLFGLYDKDKIQQEILYLNHLKYDSYSVHSDGKKQIKNKNNTPSLSYPRPNQKYGVNKVINEVIKKYQNEDNPNYELERLEKKLIADNVSEALRKATLERRKAYKNNRMQYSMLLQYAAGFGKTNIICWLSLMLKDMKEISNVKAKSSGHLFDKIILLSDRVELRDQIDLAMSNMNIEKELYKEATTTEELSKYLVTFSPRIIIVNIQKFPFLKDMAEARKKLLKDKRVAIIIDEIHRSNSGKQHTEMTTLFDDIVSATSDDGITVPKKKNLIIGLTATPTDENLIRFGEYQSCLEDIKWMPLDAYTMMEAIQDGFVLDPTKGLFPVALTIKHDEQSIKDKKMPSLKHYYEDEEEYIKPVAKKVAKILVGTTYRKINGYAKGMLACYSIAAARAFYKAINEELAKLTQLPKYQRFANSKVYMVYSSTQEDHPAHKICGYDSEKAVISAFKSDKNGLMIVVDKLQTGFDEPRLHTLFLAKETKEINAVQTLCRVNRTFKSKEDCLVIDFSIDNKNISNIKNAFEKYAHIVVSNLDTYEVKLEVERMYKRILLTEAYKEFFQTFKNKSDIKIGLKMEEYIISMLKNAHSKKILIDDSELYLNYIQKMGLIENVIGLEDKYKDDHLAKFIAEFLNLIKQKLKTSTPNQKKEIVDFWLEEIGAIENHEIDIDEHNPSGIANSKLAKSKENQEEYDILNLILEKNQSEQEKEVLIANYRAKLNKLFKTMVELDDKEDERLVIRIRDLKSGFNDQEISSSFKLIFNKAKRRLKEVGMPEFIKDIADSLSIVENDFVEYILKQDKSASDHLLIAASLFVDTNNDIPFNPNQKDDLIADILKNNKWKNTDDRK